MEFSPFNPVVKLCLQGMSLEEKGQAEEAAQLFREAWKVAGDDFEKFLAAHYIARQQTNASDKLNWLKSALACALNAQGDAIQSALPSLYTNLAGCYESLGENSKAKESLELATKHRLNPSDKGPFYHGTKADLKVGDLLLPGGNSNYQSGLKMNHIYFTALLGGAGLAAALAKGDGKERVYQVEPSGNFENDPNVTDKKFPGNPTRSYRSESPLKIIREVKNWQQPAAEDLERFRKKLGDNKGEIIN